MSNKISIPEGSNVEEQVRVVNGIVETRLVITGPWTVKTTDTLKENFPHS